MVDWDKKFKTQYDAAATALKQSDKYEKDWRPLAKKLYELLATDGFDAGRAEALGDLRDQVKYVNRDRVTEDGGILNGAAWAGGTTIDDDTKRRAAALKFLRHVYLQNKAGDHKVWVHSLPDDFKDWPTAYLLSNGGTVDKVKVLLRTGTEHFDDKQKRFLGNSAQQAMRWCQKSAMVLADAGAATASAGRTAARALVSRWFAESGLADTTLETYITTLATGFKNIIATLNKGHFIVTDWVPLRGATTADELAFFGSEAFTFTGRAEKLDVVYIESAFFKTGSNVLSGQANWTRILVHELTHLVCSTVDVNNGNARYAWYGIGPHAGYPGSDCIRNAENWAFFAGDCAGAIAESERNTALKII